MSVTFGKTHSIEDTMTTEERANLVLASIGTLVILATSFGLIVPKLIIDYVSRE